jgi:C4-dicarboxylate-specific signal transduction histidine kinase
MMGQLASALAHELNQPLGAILRNAEAAELFLQHEPPDLDELRAILADIRKDDQRAGDVIERLRGLLKRRSIEPRALAVAEALGNVAALTRADAAARHVNLEIEAAPGLPAVMSDRVHSAGAAQPAQRDGCRRGCTRRTTAGVRAGASRRQAHRPSGSQ